MGSCPGVDAPAGVPMALPAGVPDPVVVAEALAAVEAEASGISSSFLASFSLIALYATSFRCASAGRICQYTYWGWCVADTPRMCLTVPSSGLCSPTIIWGSHGSQIQAGISTRCWTRCLPTSLPLTSRMRSCSSLGTRETPWAAEQRIAWM